jgi:hypothetical protein
VANWQAACGNCVIIPACPALAIGSYGVTRHRSSITFKANVTSAARGPASSNASAMRSVNKTAVRKGVGPRATGSRARPAPPAPWLRIGRDHTPRDADRGLRINTPTAGHCPRDTGNGQCRSITSICFLISPQFENQFILSSNLIGVARRRGRN